MTVQYKRATDQTRKAFQAEFSRGKEILEAIEMELSRQPVKHGVLIQPPNRYMQIIRQPASLDIEISVVYLVGTNDNVLVEKFAYRRIEAY